MMGSGKTTMGRKIAKRIQYTFVDLDSEIEQAEGKTITELFSISGEAIFREIESVCLRSITGNRLVIATGGGTPCYHQNMAYMNEHGTTLYVKADPALIAHRLGPNRSRRPLIAGMNDEQIRVFVEEKLGEREAYYKQAEYIFEIPASTAESIVKSIGFKE
jgi:shikimate kinase